MLKKYTEICIALLIALIICGLGHFIASHTAREPKVKIQRDTLYVHDTVPVTVPEPVYMAGRIDTCWLPAVTPPTSPDLPAEKDTATVQVQVSIEKKVYETDDYRAVIEGYRANLVEMDIYRKTAYVTEEKVVTKRKRWNFTVGPQVGYGMTPAGGQPYVGVGVTFGYSF